MTKATAPVVREGLVEAFARLLAAVAAISRDEEYPAPEPMPREAPAGLWDRLASSVRAAGFAVRRGRRLGNDGLAESKSRVVWVAEDLSEAEACYTLAHELAHVVLHCGRPTDGREVEVEAEAVAFLVCHAAGLATEANAFPYMALLSDEDPEVVWNTAPTVLEAARAILSELVAA